jgi:hypothetical protein
MLVCVCHQVGAVDEATCEELQELVERRLHRCDMTQQPIWACMAHRAEFLQQHKHGVWVRQ